jgi:hypothetical protein
LIVFLARGLPIAEPRKARAKEVGMGFPITLNQVGEVRDAENRIVGYFVPAAEYERLQSHREIALAWARKGYPKEQARTDLSKVLAASPGELVGSEEFRRLLDRFDEELATQGRGHAA